MKAHESVTERRRGRPRKNEEVARRQEILKYAITAFTENGFRGTSIESVARVAGVSKMTIYNQFGSKEGLFKAIAQQVCAPSSIRLAAVRAKDRPAQHVLKDVAYAILVRPQDDMAFRLLRLSIFEQERFPDIARAIYEASVLTLRPLVDCMKQLMDAGEIQRSDPEETAMVFFSMVVRGYRFLLVDHDNPAGEDQDRPFVERVVDLFLYGAHGEPRNQL